MPTITIRLSESEKADLESAARTSGQSVSTYVRETLNLRDSTLHERVATLEGQVTALTRAANSGSGYIPDFPRSRDDGSL